MNKIFTLLLLTFAAQPLFSQSLYDLGTIQDIRIYFGFSDWDARMDTAKAGSESYILADSVVINGTRFEQCGVKYKGNSSYQASNKKNPLHIQLNYVDDNADYQGYDELKLGNGWSDNSMIREPLAFYILRQYMEAPKSNFARVYINGSYYGIMNNTEDLGKGFMLDKYYSSNNTFIKCNPETISGSSLPGLSYLGTNVDSYDHIYELKSDEGWDDLIHLCDTLNNHFDAFEQIADMDRFIWMLAFNNMAVNLDSYTGAFKQNYYLYRNHQGYWIPTVWDLNMCFGGFAVAGTGAPLSATTMQTMSYTLHKNDAAWPLLNKILNNATYSKMYYAHLRTLNQENFDNAGYKIMADSLHQLVDQAVADDQNFLGTYTNFQNALTSNTGSGMNASPGIYPLMDARADYMANVLSATAPNIAGVSAVNTATFGENAAITATVQDANTVQLGYRYKKSDRFVKVAMYDDGLHNDGAAGDKIYGAELPLQSLKVQYYIYAENANTGSFSPARAEFEFYEVEPSITPAEADDVRLNEIAANNQSNSIVNEKGKFKDWLELYNSTGEALGLGHLYLSDDAADLQKWDFPQSAFIEPGGYLLVWADDLDKTYVDFHTNFNISQAGDQLFLSDGTTVWDSVSFGAQPADVAYARCAPDNAFSLTITRTPRAQNVCTSSTGDLADKVPAPTLSPNPATDLLTIHTDATVERYVVLDIAGRVVLQGSGQQVELYGMASGTYFVQMDLGGGKWAVGRFVKI